MTQELITTTNNNFTNYLVERLNTEDEKQFALHFKIYLEHGYKNNTFPIDFDDVWKMCEFTQKINAKKILIKHFEENKDYKILLFPKEERFLLEDNHGKSCSSKMRSGFSQPERKQNGGQNKETIMLNVDTFKEFCMKASTQKAKQIRSYYIKLEKIFFSYTKDQLYYSNDRIKTLETEVNNFDVKLNKNFKNAFNKQSVVYIMKLQSFDDGTYIIKIGKTDNLTDRTSKLASLYCNKDQLVIMSVYPCEDNNNFEKFLHSNPYISQYRYTGKINDKATSIETYHINDNKYEKIKRIIDNNIYNYNGKNLDTMKENNKSLELQLKIKELELKEKEIEFNNKLYENPEFFKKLNEHYKLRQNTPLNTIIIYNDTQETINTPINTQETINTPINTNTEFQNAPIINNNIVKKREIKDCGHFVQVYDGNDTTKLLYVYNGITDATRRMEGTSFTSIKNACKKKEIYKGYRWHLVNRNDPNPNEVKDIGNSFIPRHKLEGFIAMLNKDMTEIERVFTKQKEAAAFIEQTVSAMSRAVNYKIALSDKYFILWDMVDEEIQNKYLERNELPVITDKQKARKVHQINPDTDEVVKIYLSITDLIKELRIAPKTIKKHSDKDSIYNGYKWKLI
jgi:hypothetical protein